MSVESIINRMMQALGADNEAEMLRRLSLSPGTAAQWKKRGSVPAANLLKCQQLSGKDVLWLTSERENALTFSTVPKVHDEECEYGLTDQEKRLLKLWGKADDKAKQDILERLIDAVLASKDR